VHPTGLAVEERQHRLEKQPPDRPAPWLTPPQVRIVSYSEHVSEAVVHVYGKEMRVSRRSLFLLPVDCWLRQRLISLIQWRLFDKFILLCIILNSVMLAAYQWRPNAQGEVFNHVVAALFDVLTGIFTAECALKIAAWGFIMERDSYLRDPWNVLDFIVVVSGIIEWLPFLKSSSFSFLRLFRVLRPLRSLNAYPEMKVIVNTTLCSIPKLGNVSIMGVFIFVVFSIIGITLMPGIFHRRCRETSDPVFCPGCEPGGCWQWNYTTTDSAGRLCGGRYMCEEGEFCRGHPEDVDELLRPVFSGDWPRPDIGGGKWCVGSEPNRFSVIGKEVIGIPQSDFVNFDNLGAAFLLVFQCMTKEGWTDLMYHVQDGYGTWFARVYFITMIVLTSFFMLNIALAVVDEARDNFEAKQQAENPRPDAEDPSISDEGHYGIVAPDEPWCDVAAVEVARAITRNENFSNFILLVILGNVVAMMMERFPPDPSQDRPLFVVNVLFLVIFCLEMIIELVARGPGGYIRNATTAFDGFTTLVSIIEMSTGGEGGLKALRTLRLFRVLNKLATRFPALGVMMKAMVGTARDMRYWLVLFVLAQCIFTLMLMNFFANEFHFEETDVPPTVFAKSISLPGQEDAWCPGTTDKMRWNQRQDCIPRSNFDTFSTGFVTAFQIMTGENWNTIMYAGMRAGGWPFFSLFVFLILFGQTLFLSLFLSMLISKFGDFQETLKTQVAARMSALASMASTENHQGGLLGLASIARQAQLAARMSAQMEVQGGGPSSSEASPSAAQAAGGASSSNAKSDGKEASKSLNRAASDDPSFLDSAASIVPGGEATRIYSGRELPGQLGESNMAPALPIDGASDASRRRPVEIAPDSEEREGVDEIDPAIALIADKPQWPRGYAYFLMTESNPIRKCAYWILTVDLHGLDAAAREQKKANESRQLAESEMASSRFSTSGTPHHVPPAHFAPDAPLIFDNFILVCILLNTVSMMIDGPLQDATSGSVVAFVREADNVFAMIFIFEMLVKLLAYPLVWGKNAYLWSAGCGWNWLDAIVVAVSVIHFITPDGPGFLKTLRILRALRPLRVINRNKNLKIVIETTFKSMQALGWLLVVFLLFLLIFALMLLMFLKGQLEVCDIDSIAFLRDAGQDFTAPLCLAGSFAEQRDRVISGEGVVASGTWNATAGTWEGAGCAPGLTAWQRPSADTPICIAACDPFDSGESRSPSFCPRRYVTMEELPSMCGAPLPPGDPGLIGEAFVSEMQRSYVVPCGGSTAESALAETMDGDFYDDLSPAAAVSCRQAFCPEETSKVKAAACEEDCKIHPYFCADVCKGCDSHSTCSGACLSCRSECRAACECDFCRPVSKDAALCHEQGGQWTAVVSQNFDNVFNAMLTLLEISTTEGWVDVMYAAADSVDVYVQPLRDTNFLFYAPLFVVWIFLSFMFLLNLGVGVIVDKFMSMRMSGQELFLTEAQKKWKMSRKNLYGRALVYNLENLHRLPPNRRRIYDIVESPLFDNFIMTCIVLNTIIMCMKVFPEPTRIWEEVFGSFNYAFAAIYTAEAMLKLLAYRFNYFRSSWNCFDLFCVAATFAGLALQFGFPDGPNVGPIMSVLRIFRVARLFRLLKVLKELNRLFLALLLSVPKLVNVVGILLLLLVLYSILGVQLFATAKASETLNEHGNFQDFWRAFTTLFRASTGEAWNQIMHDLGKDEVDFFREGTWCAPADLYDWQSAHGYEILQSKCLIEHPSSCVQTLWGWNILPQLYWVGYILIVGQVVMNLVISVILDGYEEVKEDATQSFEVCKRLWPKYDPDLRMSLPMKEALKFIWEATKQVVAQDGAMDCPDDLTKIPMKFAKAMDLFATGQNGKVHFKVAVRQVLRFVAVLEHPDKPDIVKELNETDNYLSRREAKRLRALEGKAHFNDGKRSNSEEAVQEDITARIAAMKVQKVYRARQAARQANEKESQASRREGRQASQGSEGRLSNDRRSKRESGRGQGSGFPAQEEPEHVVMTPPVAG